MASLLAETSLNKEQQDYVTTIQASGEHLLTVINDVLDFSKQEAGKLELLFGPVDMLQTMEQAIELAFRTTYEVEVNKLYFLCTVIIYLYV
jgi:signal transduction histidine kinase